MIDLSRKIIFTHPKKCAGTTIEGWFGMHPSNQKDADKEAFSNNFRKIKHASLDEHFDILQSFNEDASKYFVFSCIRNPWDRAVSLYFHKKINAVKKFKKLNPDKELPRILKKIEQSNFKTFLNIQHWIFKNTKRNPLATRPFVLSKSGRKPDFIIRYENYADGLQFISKKFNLDYSALKSHNTTTRPKGVHYRDYYTSPRMVSIIAEICSDSIEDFGYKF
jgi:chondroitin 4-sulfotransferase 11